MREKRDELLGKAERMWRAGDMREALRLARAAARGDARGWELEGNIRVNFLDWSGAAAAYGRAVRLRPADAGLRARLSECRTEASALELTRRGWPRASMIACQTEALFSGERAEKALSRLSPRAQALAHLGELELWRGRYARARGLLRGALRLQDDLRWPRVGLAAVELLTGRPAEAVSLLAEARAGGSPETVVAVWEAEALRRAGRPSEALKRAAAAMGLQPPRPAAAVNYALLRGEDCRRRTLELLEASSPAWIAEARGLGGGSARGTLEAALRLLRGNRSSWLPGWWKGGRLRLVSLTREGAAEIAGFR